MNVARWTPSPLLERETEAIFRTEARIAVRQRIAAYTFVASFIVFLSARNEGVIQAAFLMSVASLAFVGGLKRSRQGARETAWLRDAASLDEFGDRDAWLVDLMVLQGEAPTGSDRGMMWIEDDRLYFAGRRTSFGLSADQADDFCRGGLAVPGLRHELGLRLLAPVPLSISFEPIVGAKWQQSRRSVRDLRGAVNGWAGVGASEGGQLPPLALGPDAPSAGRLILGAAFAGGYWATALASFVLLFPSLPIQAVVLAMVAIMVGSFWGPASSPLARLRAYRDRRRLA